MKKLAVFLTLSLLTACSNGTAVRERSFNVDFKYGYGAHDTELDTFHDTYTKDMVMEDPVSTTLVLTDEELAVIQGKIDSLQLFSEDTASHG